MIWTFLLGGFSVWITLGLLRAKSEARRLAGELKGVQDSRIAFENQARADARASLEIELSVFRTTELEAARQLARDQAKLEYDQKLSGVIEKQRAQAIQQSKAVNRGLIAEQLAPHMAGFAYNPKDCHWVGHPIDYLVFDGLDAGKLKQIVLLEVKTGESQMNARERQVRDTVQEGLVSYEIFRLDTEND